MTLFLAAAAVGGALDSLVGLSVSGNTPLRGVPLPRVAAMLPGDSGAALSEMTAAELDEWIALLLGQGHDAAMHALGLGGAPLHSGGDERARVFGAVHPTVWLAPPVIASISGKGVGQDKKNLLVLPRRGRCVVYGMGLADVVGFENEMAARGCEVHGFDCTIATAPVDLKGWTFHPWCIGRRPGGAWNPPTYAARAEAATAAPVFKTLREVMDDLGHADITVLKFDIEGHEWGIFEHEILQWPRPLAAQLAFELHTEKANPAYVPAELTKSKGRPEVTHLFAQLTRLGYAVVSKEINLGDPACAEFVLARV